MKYRRWVVAAATLLAVLGPAVQPAAAVVESGSLELDDPVSWGDTATFTVETTGRLGAKESIYVSTVCIQNDDVVLQYSTDYAVPLVQQEGLAQLGYLINTEEPADCEAWLVSRINRREDIVRVLDIETFVVTA